MTQTEQAEAELTEKFIQHHMRDDSRNSYVQNGKWAYSRGYRAGLKQAASPKREWVGLTVEDMEVLSPHGSSVWVQETVKIIEAKLKEKNQ